MENLPELVIGNIAKFLSVKDLGACCSTSKSSRNVFNQDHVWRPFCDQMLAAHLKVTECQVEPRFVAPEPEDSSLSPICEWRLCYMREVHLWNNWRQDRYKEEFIGSIRYNKADDGHNFKFINSNLMLIKLSHEKRVMLWDVKETPAHLYDPVTLKFDVYIDFCEIIEDSIFFVQKDTIQKYKINDSTTAAWELQGIYNLSSPPHKIFIASHFLVTWILDDIIEIFDLTSCETVTISKIPRALTDTCRVHMVEKGGISSMYLIVLLFQWGTQGEQETDNSVEEPVEKHNMNIYVYSIDKLDFIDFNITIPVNEWYPNFTCTIHEEFLTVFYDGSIKVYRYLTSELVLDAPYAFTSTMVRRLPPSYFQLPELQFYTRNRIDKLGSGDLSVLINNSHLCSGLSPIVRHCIGYKPYDIARLLRHVRKYLTLPTEMFGVVNIELYECAVINNIYTKTINWNISGPYLVTLW